MFKNSKSLYVTSSAEDVVAVDVYEHHGMVTIEIGEKFQITVNPDDVYDLVDALTIVANGVDSHTGEV